MSLQVKTLQGGVFKLDVRAIETVQQLKKMLLEKFPGGSVDQKILTVEVLHGNCLLKNDAQTLSEAALHAESDVTVIYRPNQIEAAGKKDVYTHEFCQVNIPQGVKKVSDQAFMHCKNLVKATIPDSVTEIGTCAFFDCSSLESITIPDSVQQIGSRAFDGCSSLESITIPDSVQQIGSRAFDCCSSLKSITTPDSVTEIGSHAFDGCKSLERIAIPDSMKQIGSSAFEGCRSLERIAIPDSVTEQCLCRLQLFEKHHDS